MLFRSPWNQADGSKGVFFWLNALYATLRRRLVGKGNGQIPQMETGDGIQRKDGLEGAGEGVDAAFEKKRLSLYREAAKEAEEIFDRWADEIDDLDKDFMEDEDYEPDEYYSD